MLYGIRRDLQASLVAQGYRVRIYIPFGRQWFPYFMRRLGERPANVAFVLRGIVGERSASSGALGDIGRRMYRVSRLKAHRPHGRATIPA